MNGISTKGAAAVFGSAISTLVWTLLASFVHAVSSMDHSNLATVEGGTSIVLGGFLFYFVPEMRQADAVVTPVEPPKPTAA